MPHFEGIGEAAFYGPKLDFIFLVGILIEQYAGDFPLWLATEQVRLLPIGEEVMSYAQGVVSQMRALGIRAEVDCSGDRLGKQIRNAETQKIPVMAIIGIKEKENNSLSLRTRALGDLGAISVSEALTRLKQSIDNHGTTL